MYCFARRNSNRDINTSKLIATCETEATVISFLRRVQSVICNRKFVVSKDNGWIGLVPKSAKVRHDMHFVWMQCTHYSAATEHGWKEFLDLYWRMLRAWGDGWRGYGEDECSWIRI